ncbi:hypothetical protein [Nonomuraea sp. SYSU D8015]|uniref:hypothetical protein n=1 Tax=Nonomuraea sp. SYSU D8015 TaxID=2593644 RepID=UPI001660DFA2|nr:hypothetical protein [Nonomuraea sp. SYSU D8015]
MIISWSGSKIGDGVQTEGTSRARGILTLSVTWTVIQDKGVFVPDRNNGGYWSNCSSNSPHYPGTPAGSRP